MTEVCARHGPAVAFSCRGHTLSYRQLDRLSDLIATWLRHATTLAPGDRVALQLPNLLQFPVLVLAVLKAGLVLVNLNPQYTSAELQQQLQDSGARLLVTLPGQFDGSAVAPKTSALQYLIATEPDDLHVLPAMALQAGAVAAEPCIASPAARDPAASAAAMAHPAQATAAGNELRQYNLQQVLQHGAVLLQQHGPLPLPCDPAALALLQYTGGTTGVPKAAMLSHRNLLANVTQLHARIGGHWPAPGEVMLAPLPLYHIYAFTLGLLGSMVRGNHILLIPDARDLPALLQAMQSCRIAGMFGVDTLYRRLCEHPGFAAVDTSALRLCSAGGMALSPAVAQRWLQRTGCAIIEGYGLSECAPLLACNTCDDLRAGSVGRLVPDTRLCLQAADGRCVAAGDAGEICVKGPQVMQGYWKRPQETAQAFDADGWFHTGDVGVLDADGYLHLVDRLKDLIIVSGFKVYPAEVEARVCQHPAVTAACVVGVDSAAGQQVKLFVTGDAAAVTAAQLIDWCRAALAPYKVPRQVEFRATLPCNSLGKVLRRTLRESGGRDDRCTV